MNIKEAFVAEGDLYEVSGEDGPRAVFDYYVDVEAVDGKRYRHFLTFHVGYYAELLAKKVGDAGVVNLTHWFEVQRRPSYALGEVDEVSLMDDEERFHKGL